MIDVDDFIIETALLNSSFKAYSKMTNWNPDINCAICHTYLYSLRAGDYTRDELLAQVACDNPECQKKLTLLLLKEKKNGSST